MPIIPLLCILSLLSIGFVLHKNPAYLVGFFGACLVLAYTLLRKKPKEDALDYLIADLTQAINDNELSVIYLPKKSLITGSLFGVEAAIRWNNPLYGEISPYVFIPLAEKHRRMSEITEWVLKKALSDFVELKENGLKSVSIQLSINDVIDGKILRVLSNELAVKDIDTTQVVLEINQEEAYLAGSEELKGLMCLAVLGFPISIRKPPQASIESLSGLPIKELKIKAEHLSKDDVIAAHSIGWVVCAEFVEDLKTEYAVRSLGCDAVQGFAVSAPQTFENLMVLLRNDV